MNTRLKEDLRLATCLGLLGALAAAALFPYLMAVMPQMLSKIPKGISLTTVIVLQSLQAFVLLGLCAFVGLLAGRRVGLDVPWLRAMLGGAERPRQAWGRAIALGLGVAIVMVLIDTALQPLLPAAMKVQPVVSPMRNAVVGFLASFYGGIDEEILLRLFVMTVLMWIASHLFRERNRGLQAWVAIVIAAVVFGAAHLPAAAAISPLDAMVVTRVLVLNSLGGLLFGWLYWKQGLESAMLAHFSADLVLHVVAPLLVG